MLNCSEAYRFNHWLLDELANRLYRHTLYLREICLMRTVLLPRTELQVCLLWNARSDWHGCGKTAPWLISIMQGLIWHLYSCICGQHCDRNLGSLVTSTTR